MMFSSTGAEALPCFSDVVENVRTGHPDGLDQLYRVFRVLAGSLRRQLGYQDFDDRIHDMFLVVVDAIRTGKLRDAGALPSYIHGVARLSLYSNIGVRARHDRLIGVAAALGFVAAPDADAGRGSGGARADEHHAGFAGGVDGEESARY